MKWMKVLVVVSILIGMIGVPLRSQAADKVMVGYAVMRMVDEYWENQIRGMKDAIKESGRDIDLQIADCNNDGQMTLQNSESLLDRGAKVLLVSTPDPTVGGAIMEKAKAKGVPVVASDIPIEGAYFLTHDDFKAGETVGDYAGQYFQEKFKGQKAKIAIIVHLAVDFVLHSRQDGFVAGFKKSIPDAVALPIMDAEGLREKGTTVMADILTANPDVNVVFAINDDMALGAASAVEERGLVGKIIVFGQGGIGEASFRGLLEPNSPFIGTTAYMPYDHGKTMVNQYAIPLLDGKTVEKRINSPLKLATKANAQEFLDQYHQMKKK